MSRQGRVIEVRDLQRAFGTQRAVDGLSFTVKPATITGFLGPNGAGKTTTLRMLLGLVTPDAGTATIGGMPYRALADPARVVGAALEPTGFHPARTGRAHLGILAAAIGLPRERVDDVLDTVRLTEAADRRVDGYSLGMRQRLALAAALLGDPEVVILDEPANGLDPQGISWMRRFLRQLAKQGRTVLVSSHLLSEMQQLVDHVLIIDRGRLILQGELREISATNLTVRVRTPDAERLQNALVRAGIEVARDTGQQEMRCVGVDPAEIGRIAHAESVEVSWLATESTSLEELFLSLTGHAPTVSATRREVRV